MSSYCPRGSEEPLVVQSRIALWYPDPNPRQRWSCWCCGSCPGQWPRARMSDCGLAVLALSFGSVIAHELGHAFAARGYEVETREIVVHPFGGLARFERGSKGESPSW